MGKLVQPETYFVGATGINFAGLTEYLLASGNDDFLDSITAAREAGLSEGEILVSFYAKLCYASLSVGHNKNISRVRDIPDNLRACWDQGHGSVWEHCQINFVVRNCSRVFTHELIRHRAGARMEGGGDDTDVVLRAFEHEAAFSQTSGRYVRGDEVDIVFDPILEPVQDDIVRLQSMIESHYAAMVRTLGLDKMTDFAKKKKLTSALRRMLPNGQSNEIGFSCNLRAIRHTVQLRTSRHAEWEIRLVFGQVYRLLKDKYPLLFHGAREEEVDGLLEVSGMKMQPYEPVLEEKARMVV